MRRNHLIAAAVIVVVVVAGGVAALVFNAARQRSQRQAEAVVDEWLEHWRRSEFSAMRDLAASPPPTFLTSYESARKALDPATSLYRRGKVRTGARAGAPFHAELTLRGLGRWEYDGRLDLVRTDGKWRVRWSPAAIHPALTDGRALARQRSFSPRAPLLDVHGQPLNGRDADLTAVAGTVGPATAEKAAALGDPFVAGDAVGQFGLQASFERQLAGRPSGAITVTDPRGGQAMVLVRFEGAAGQAAQTTFDPATQVAAERALDGVPQPAALVAIDAPSGQVRAVVSRPSGGFPRALQGRYPPGSTFKVVTTAAALQNGLTPDARVDCPPDIAVGGRTFVNAEEESFGPVPFSFAFAHSCNTAFVNVAKGLSAQVLTSAANAFGFGSDYRLPVPSFAGSFPEPKDDTEKVAAAIGQGRVEASPLSMASVAAAVSSGAWRAPALIVGAETAQPRPMPEGVGATLRVLMRGAVTSGTGTAANVGNVAGKTGTAEFGNATPPRTHAWFIGFRGDLAFAVLVEDGGFGGDVAAPIAARFLRGVR